MGCDIHAYAERKDGKKFKPVKVVVFDNRSYGIFGFLANVRNYSGVPPIAERRGFPSDAATKTKTNFENWGCDAHSPSWLSVEELLSFDYDQPVEDRRVTRQISENFWSGGETADTGGGTMTTFREFLGEWFFKDLDKLREAGADRVVFWFDN